MKRRTYSQCIWTKLLVLLILKRQNILQLLKFTLTQATPIYSVANLADHLVRACRISDNMHPVKLHRINRYKVRGIFIY